MGDLKFVGSWSEVWVALETPKFVASIWNEASLVEAYAFNLWNLA